jgi:hypothetical protein
MVNWFRTYLMNIDSSTAGTAGFADELIPSEFHPVDCPGTVTKLRRALFGVNPDSHLLNYRMRQLLPLVHSTELDELVRDQDSRITYLPVRDSDLFEDARFVATASFIYGTGNLALYGHDTADDGNGTAYRSWQVHILSSSSLEITTLTSQQKTTHTGLTIPASSGLSETISLPGSALSFALCGPVGALWSIQSVSRPSWSVADLWQKLQDTMTLADENSLFGVAPVEPYLTLRNLWLDHPQFGYRFSAVLLAMALRTKEAT